MESGGEEGIQGTSFPQMDQIIHDIGHSATLYSVILQKKDMAQYDSSIHLTNPEFYPGSFTIHLL